MDEKSNSNHVDFTGATSPAAVIGEKVGRFITGLGRNKTVSTTVQGHEANGQFGTVEKSESTAEPLQMSYAERYQKAQRRKNRATLLKVTGGALLVVAAVSLGVNGLVHDNIESHADAGVTCTVMDKETIHGTKNTPTRHLVETEQTSGTPSDAACGTFVVKNNIASHTFHAGKTFKSLTVGDEITITKSYGRDLTVLWDTSSMSQHKNIIDYDVVT
jgi:hypothetical protein